MRYETTAQKVARDAEERAALLARAEAAEAERDRLREQAHRMAAEVDDLAKQRIERNARIKAAEARADRYEKALEKIAADQDFDRGWQPGPLSAGESQRLARAALAGEDA